MWGAAYYYRYNGVTLDNIIYVRCACKHNFKSSMLRSHQPMANNECVINVGSSHYSGKWCDVSMRIRQVYYSTAYNIYVASVVFVGCFLLLSRIYIAGITTFAVWAEGQLGHFGFQLALAHGPGGAPQLGSAWAVRWHDDKAHRVWVALAALLPLVRLPSVDCRSIKRFTKFAHVPAIIKMNRMHASTANTDAPE